MPILRCPHCKLPLVDDEARGATCPLCNGVLAGGPPAAVATQHETPSAAAPGRRSVLGVASGVFLALLSAALLYLAVQPEDPFSDKGHRVTKVPAPAGEQRAPEALPLPGNR